MPALHLLLGKSQLSQALSSQGLVPFTIADVKDMIFFKGLIEEDFG